MNKFISPDKVVAQSNTKKPTIIQQDVRKQQHRPVAYMKTTHSHQTLLVCYKTMFEFIRQFRYQDTRKLMLTNRRQQHSRTRALGTDVLQNRTGVAQRCICTVTPLCRSTQNNDGRL